MDNLRMTTPKLEIRKATQRGVAEHGWLSSRHTFSFANYYDPTQTGFSDLLVINDDRVMPNCGFDTHGHRNMEIFSYVLQGKLTHKDSMERQEIALSPNEVQLMSAGSGITHSEYNNSAHELVHFLQIWIVPQERDVLPRYQQRQFPLADKQGKLLLLISPDGAEHSLKIRQDTKIYAGCFNGSQQTQYTIPSGRYTYVHVARGTIDLNGTVLQEGDGVKIRESGLLNFTQGQQAEVLLFDLRAQEVSS